MYVSFKITEMKMVDSLFARYQLEKHGWTEGAGLGKHENGITAPIKVALKNNKDGVGHIPGSDLTENWWDQVYNKVASKILVKTTKDSVAVHATETKESNKNKSLLYARFVKGATLKASEGIIVEEPEKSSESESEKEQIPPRLTDEEILKICGGRTAHKAAGHGLKQNGKLQRIQEQERQYLESLNKKADVISNSTISETKREKKHKRVVMEGMNSQEEEVSRKKRKKESKGEVQMKNATELEEFTKIKKKKKKKCKEKREQNKKDKKNCVIEDETFISNKSEKKKRKKEYLEEVNKESEEASDVEKVEIIEKKKQCEMEEYDETEQEFKEMTKKKNKHRSKREQLEKVVSTGKKKRRKHEEEEEAEYTKENPSLNQSPNKMDQEEKGDERKKKSKKKRKKEHKKKKQETEKSLIENEDLQIKVQEQKIGGLSDKNEEEINENAFKQEPVKVDSCQKKVRFSLELVTVFTISDEENETHVPSKKKKKKHQTSD